MSEISRFAGHEIGERSACDQRVRFLKERARLSRLPEGEGVEFPLNGTSAGRGRWGNNLANARAEGEEGTLGAAKPVEDTSELDPARQVQAVTQDGGQAAPPNTKRGPRKAFGGKVPRRNW